MSDHAPIVPFVFEDQLVRTIVLEGEPWFVAKDICAALNLKGDAGQNTRRLPEGEKGLIQNQTPGGFQDMIVVSEPGLYRLIFRSDKPEANRFQDFVFHDVLPTLRRTGSYTVPGREDDADLTDEMPARRASGDHVAELTAKTAAVREARILMGRAFAARVWQELGMPAAGDMRMPLATVPPLLEDEAFAILCDLMSAPDRDGVIIGDQVARAVEMKRSDLVEPLGLKLVWRIAGRPCPEGALFVANAAPAIASAFAGTARAADAALRLRDLPGAAAGHARIGVLGFNGRGTIVPIDQLARALEVVAQSPYGNHQTPMTSSFVNEVYP